MTKARKRACYTRGNLVKFFVLEMAPKTVCKTKMNDIHTDLNTVERKLNAAIAVAQEQPVVYNRGSHYKNILGWWMDCVGDSKRLDERHLLD